MSSLTENLKLYNTALTELSNISKCKTNEIQDRQKRDIFLEALLILLTKVNTSSHSLLNTNLSDYLWFNLQK